MLKKLLTRMFDNAMKLNKRNILNFLDKNESARLLDLGCDDGVWTSELASRIGTRDIYGIEIVDERIKMAEEKGIKVKKGDLNHAFPFEDNFFDVAHANQVIEHIAYLDSFVMEIKRVLKPGGYAVISTENASSWHNIFASIMGWQIFSLTNVSGVASRVGNPLAIHKNEVVHLNSWTHKTIFNYRGLIDFFKAHGFSKVIIAGAGYHPLPAVIGRLDRRHSHFITIKAFK